MPGDASGMLVKGADSKIVAVTDGTSNTIMFGECAGRPEYFLRGANSSALDLTNKLGRNGQGWADPDAGFSMSDTSVPQAVNKSNDGEFYSFHSGTCNVTMGDGSVRSINQSINPMALAAMVTARGGEVVSD